MKKLRLEMLGNVPQVTDLISAESRLEIFGVKVHYPASTRVGLLLLQMLLVTTLLGTKSHF